MSLKYRALYKYDLENNLVLPFYLQEFDDELKFVLEESIPIAERMMYDVSVPFLDEDWIVTRWSGYSDYNGVDIYECDLVTFQYTDKDEYHSGLVVWDPINKCLGIQALSHDHKILPFGNFVLNGVARITCEGLYPVYEYFN